MERLLGIGEEDLQRWAIEARVRAIEGQLPNYIPHLSQANPEALAVCLQSLDGGIVSIGDRGLTFPLMSAIKPFTLLYTLMVFGSERVFDRVGKEPSDYPFYSLTQLQEDRGFPRNPMINSGAIALADLLLGNDGFSRCETLRNWLNEQGNCQLFLDESVFASVISKPNPRNLALVEKLGATGVVQNVTLALETYNYICCLSGTVGDLASLGMVILHSPPGIRSIVLEIMTTCGLYEASGTFAQEVGFPAKSAVSGVILSAIEGKGAIALYSPPLDERGNSIASLYMLEKIAKVIGL
jgi:glutaminase